MRRLFSKHFNLILLVLSGLYVGFGNSEEEAAEKQDASKSSISVECITQVMKATAITNITILAGQDYIALEGGPLFWVLALVLG